jgi:hypothetical protein
LLSVIVARQLSSSVLLKATGPPPYILIILIIKKGLITAQFRELLFFSSQIGTLTQNSCKKNASEKKVKKDGMRKWHAHH